VRPSEPSRNDLDEAVGTLIVSRDGVYFSTQVDHCFTHIRFLINFWYATAPGAINSEYIGEVKRVNHLPDGGYGVQVRFLTTTNFHGQCSHVEAKVQKSAPRKCLVWLLSPTATP
jgi:hypothetical protein